MADNSQIPNNILLPLEHHEPVILGRISKTENCKLQCIFVLFWNFHSALHGFSLTSFGRLTSPLSGGFLTLLAEKERKSIIQYRSWQAGCQDQKLCILNPFQSSSISTIHNPGIKISIEMRPTDTSVNIA